eukprot:365861-Chlamydomonas_euryale.AAC.31
MKKSLWTGKGWESSKTRWWAEIQSGVRQADRSCASCHSAPRLRPPPEEQGRWSCIPCPRTQTPSLPGSAQNTHARHAHGGGLWAGPGGVEVWTQPQTRAPFAPLTRAASRLGPAAAQQPRL